MVHIELFAFPFLTSQNVPYFGLDAAQMSATVDGGVLSKHQIVWLMESRQIVSNETTVAAFVEGIGGVLIDGRYLIDLSSLLNNLREWDESRSDVPSR